MRGIYLSRASPNITGFKEKVNTNVSLGTVFPLGNDRRIFVSILPFALFILFICISLLVVIYYFINCIILLVILVVLADWCCYSKLT